MQPEEPLEFEEIAEYLEQPEAAAYTQYRRRLLDSRLSRQRVDLAWRIQQTLREDPLCASPDVGDEAALTPGIHAELQLLRSGKLNEERGASLRARLQSEPRQLREALHFCVAEGMPEKPASPARKSIGVWLARLFEWRVPAWTAAGTAAVLVLAVVLLSPFGVGEDSGLRLAAYRDDPVIRFAAQNSLPGLGFFADAQTETQPFADVSLRLQGTELAMRWPEVDGAHGYTVQLLVVEQGRQREIANLEVAAAAAMIGDLRPVAGQRYVWMISGTTTGQRKFATRGGFVLQ